MTEGMVYIGIDPGVAGGIAILLPDNLLVFDTPVCEATRGHDYLPAEMVALLRPYAGATAILEQVAAPRIVRGVMSGNVTAAQKIGYGAGLWVGILVALGMRYERPRPEQWRKLVGLPTGTNKDQSRLRAQALYPVQADLFKRKKDDGRAEAALMATYGVLRWGSAGADLLSRASGGRKAGVE